MHYLTYGLIPAAGDAKAIVEQTLAPFSEEESRAGFWDWYQIGGRWTGHLTGYDPEKDPANVEKCNLCDGTGIRTDDIGVEMGQPTQQIPNAVVAREVGRTHGWCNGCDGRGKHATWPTNWRKHDGDVQPAAVALARAEQDENTLPYLIVITGAQLRI